MKYFIKTYGCQMNEAESERIAAFLEKKGYRPVKDKYKADLVVINTCSVRESAENRVFGLINNLTKWKAKILATSHQPPATSKNNLQRAASHVPRAIVTGCMLGSALGKRKRYALKQLKKKLPGVKLIPLEKLLKGFKDKPKRKKKKTALVPIMKGCNNFCTYCVVPYARGKEVSRPFEEIVCEVKALVKDGYEEVMLLGQNVNSYQKNKKFPIRLLPEKGPAASTFRHVAYGASKTQNYKTPFAQILVALNEIKGLKKIKFMTSNPWDLTDDIIEALKLPKVDRYLHLPVQSGNDEILRKMNRKYTAKEYLALIKKVRKAVPDIKIGTDIIVGFPGETNEQFENTVKLCKKAGFSVAYIAKYSPRPGTAAFKLEDNVAMEEKKRRWRVLEKLINKERTSQ